MEDTDFIVNYVKSKLITINLEILIAKDGEDGVRKGQIERPNLIIADLMLPKMDGFEVCQQINSNPKTKDTRIIIMSTRNSKENVLRCYKLGIDDYLIKPFGLDDFEQRITRLLYS
ncbi:PleD family two-component system response regulator [Desulfosporosinus sp. SB140]|uniref:response regulator n=1 Tax=Desulfosporosinus paludis TaxID=3115649 RepID=UPI00388EF3C9